MEKTYNPALIQRTQRYMETHSISQNQFAAKVNLSSAALSSYLNQKYGAAPAADKPAEIPANSEKAATSLLQNITVGPVSSGDAAAVVAVCKEHGATADSYTNAENHLQIICIRSVVQAVADAVLAVCKERKLTDAKLYTSHWA